MKTYYFTLGSGHAKEINGFYYDHNIVCGIKAENSAEARKIMFAHFNDKWAFQYDSMDDLKLSYFPRGIKILNGEANR